MNPIDLIKSKITTLRLAMSLFFILAMVLSFLGGKKINTVYIVGEQVITVHDTIPRDSVIYQQIPAKIETVQVEVVQQVPGRPDTVFLVLTEKASVDTIFPNDGELSVAYYTIPKRFDIEWNPYPLEVRCKQILNGTIGISPPGKDVMQFRLGAGLGKGWKDNTHFSAIFGVDILDNSAYIEADENGWTVGYMRKFGGF